MLVHSLAVACSYCFDPSWRACPFLASMDPCLVFFSVRAENESCLPGVPTLKDTDEFTEYLFRRVRHHTCPGASIPTSCLHWPSFLSHNRLCLCSSTAGAGVKMQCHSKQSAPQALSQSLNHFVFVWRNCDPCSIESLRTRTLTQQRRPPGSCGNSDS